MRFTSGQSFVPCEQPIRDRMMRSRTRVNVVSRPVHLKQLEWDVAKVRQIDEVVQYFADPVPGTP